MSRISLPLSLTLIGALSATPVFAQGILQKLEKKLKDAIAPAAKPADPNVGELPPPTVEMPLGGYLGLKAEETQKGVIRVQAVAPKGPAEAAGIRAGDQVIAIDKNKISDIAEMGDLLEKSPAGATVNITILRDSKELDLAVQLGEPPADARLGPAAVVGSPGGGASVLTGRASLGITVLPLTPEAREKNGLTVNRGAFISAIRQDSPADRAGLPLGGVIVAIDGRRIDTADELVQIIRGARPGQELELTYYQGDKLARKTVKLAPTVDAATIPIGSGGLVGPGPAGGPGIIGPDRPFLRRVEKIVGGIGGGGLGPALGAPGLAPPGLGPVGPAMEPADVANLRQTIDNLQAQVRLMEDRLRTLEAKLDAKDADNKPAEKTPKLDAPEKPKSR